MPKVARGGRPGVGPKAGSEATVPLLGLTVAQVTPDIAQQLGLERPVGVVVTDVDKSSPAVNLQEGDVILAVNDAEIANEKAFVAATQRIKKGDTIRMLVVREGTPSVSDPATDSTR